jgi:putative aldouronate transport system permease protein
LPKPKNSFIHRAPSISKASIIKVLQNDWQLYLLILPAVLYVFIFHYVPMYGVQIAFKDFSTRLGIWDSPWVGFKHFIRFITYPNFGKIVWNTLSITLYNLVTYPIPIILALLFNELNSQRFRKVVQMVSYAPHFVSTVVVCSMLILFTDNNNGLFNHMIRALGGTGKDWLSQPSLFPSLYVWSGVWQSAGWSTIIFLAALSGVSPELYEAAYMDGASRFQIILHVNIPALAPTIITMFIMRVGQIMSLGFEKIYLLQNSLNLDASQVISTYVYEMGVRNGQFSYASAIDLFNTAINILLLFVVNKISQRVANVSLW